MTLLITGGAGFIGAQTAWLALEAGLSVVVVDDLSTGRRQAVPPGAVFVEGDAGDEDLVGGVVADYGVTAVMHFAAKVVAPESVARPLDYYAANTAETIRLLRACAKGGVDRWVVSSTAAVYGASTPSAVETSPTAPVSPYGRSKLMAETIARDAAAATGARAAVLRYFNVAGADPAGRCGQSTANATHLVKVSCEVATGRRAVLEVHGDDWPTRDGTGVRDYVHVHDLARAHLAALDHLLEAAAGETAVFNLGSGVGWSVKEVAAAVAIAAGRSLPLTIGARRPGDVAELVADAGRAGAVLGWTPRLGIADIAEHALAWERRLNAPCGRLESERPDGRLAQPME